MIDKLTLNNEIVGMRKLVRQAKVHVINKLVREVKKLRQRHGPENVKAKFNRKADRKGEEILFIKKLTIDDVSKFALKNSENPIEKLSDPNTTTEGRAMFRLASHKIIAERVNQFRAQHPDWKDFIYETLDELGARRKKIAKGSVKSKSKSDPNEQKFSTSGKQGRKEQQSKKLLEDIAPQSNVLRDSSDEVNDEIGESISKVTVNEVKSKFLSQWIVQDLEPIKEESEKTCVDEFEKNNNIKKLQGKKLPKNNKFSSFKGRDGIGHSKKTSGIAEIKKFCELADRNNHVPDKKKFLGISEDVPASDDKVSPSDKEAVDPFFVGADGKTEYHTSVVVEEHDAKDDAESWNRERKPFGKEWDPRKEESHRDRGLPRRDKGPFGRGGQINRERGGQRGKGPRFGGRGEPWGNDNTFKRNSGTPAEEVNLHPSWEAKRKQKEQSISNVVFQGKKIKFDDDDD